MMSADILGGIGMLYKTWIVLQLAVRIFQSVDDRENKMKC
jgi:hypothetical protein